MGNPGAHTAVRNEFSVLMLVYAGDRPEHFHAALRSITGQTLPPAEIVLVVDGPVPEATEEVIRYYENELAETGTAFRVIRSERNLGCGGAKRLGFAQCRYPLIAMMDADDLSVPDRFEKQLRFYEDHPEVSVFGGWITEFISGENPTDISRKAGSRTVPESDAEIRAYMTKRCPMNHVTVMVKKDDIQDAGGYRDKYYWNEDYDLWIRLALAGRKFGNVPCNLVNVRVGEEMYQRRGGMKYFRSEAALQKVMLDGGMISFPRYLINVTERLVLQVLMPGRVRGWVFRKFARE